MPERLSTKSNMLVGFQFFGRYGFVLTYLYLCCAGNEAKLK